MSCGKTVLEIDGLNVSIAASQCCQELSVVNGVSLTVSQGQVTGLIGESGSGKSLTCLSVMNLLPPAMVRDKGSITLSGAPLEDAPASQWRCFRGRRAAMILQNPMSCFDPVFTIGHHIRETLSAHGLNGQNSGAKIGQTLAELGFDHPDEILSAYPFQLSGGMLQRVMITLALLLEAELLIADEPTTDLDVIVQARILDIIDRLRREKRVGVLLVTHDLSVIARLADQVSVMHSGTIVESGSVADIFYHPQASYTRALLDAHFTLYGQNISSSNGGRV